MRFVLTVLAMAFAMMSTARAETPNWQEYRPKDIGFRVEMPGDPVLKTTKDKNGSPDYSAMVALDKSVAGAEMVFLVKYSDMDQKPGPVTEGILDTVAKAQAEGGKLLKMKKEALDGYPATRVTIEDADKDTSELRGVITEHRFIQILFLGPVGDPLGRRFLDSFAVVEP